MNTLTCHTSGCPNNNQPIEMELTVTDPLDGSSVYVDQVVCGICQQAITDINPPVDLGGSA